MLSKTFSKFISFVVRSHNFKLGLRLGLCINLSIAILAVDSCYAESSHKAPGSQVKNPRPSKKTKTHNALLSEKDVKQISELVRLGRFANLVRARIDSEVRSEDLKKAFCGLTDSTAKTAIQNVYAMIDSQIEILRQQSHLLEAALKAGQYKQCRTNCTCGTWQSWIEASGITSNVSTVEISEWASSLTTDQAIACAKQDRDICNESAFKDLLRSKP